MRRLPMTAAILSGLLCTGIAFAAATPEAKCQATKHLAVGKYVACRQNAEKGLALTADSSKYDDAIAKCEATLGKSWQNAIDKASAAGATCLDSPLLVGGYKTVMDALSHNVATALSGGGLTLPDTCGNGTVEADEVCDFGTLGGQTCAGATANAAPYGKLACGAGCVFDTSACLPCPGAAVLGACWVQASKGASCTSACTNSGLGYDPATATLAGSGASAADCLTLASAIYPFWTSPPYPSPLTVQNIGSSGVGCGVFNLPTILHDTNPTTGDATDAQVARFCACH